MKLRHVVTVFLVHPDGRRLLAGRRSEQVHTYPGRWAGISGAVEAGESPAEAAARELHEETGLPADAWEQESAGLAVRAVDWDLGCLWVIHPFLFRCRRPDDVRRDWEHVELQWTRPEELWDRRTVPRLCQAWESARAGRPDPDTLLERVRDDHEHGAEQLGIWTLQALAQAARQGADAPGACRRALELRPSMAAVRSAGLRAWQVLRDGEGDGPAGLDDRVEQRRRGPLRAARVAADHLPGGAHVVTLSRSFSVLCVLHEARDSISRLTVAESRPACEGHHTAATAASMGLEVELVTDAAACGRVRDADAVLLGADSLAAGGGFVNKTGSLALCAAAHAFGVPTMVVATPAKVLPEGVEPPMEQGDPGELGDVPKGVTVANPTFEPVPAELVGLVALPTGPASQDAIARTAAVLRELQDDLRDA